jgi:glycosyltransferase involved in cell wall biosynthesis
VNDRPIVICAGFFADRHAKLLESLSQRFEILLFEANGVMPISSPHIKDFQLEDAETADEATIRKTAQGYYRLLDWVKRDAELSCDKESLMARTRFLVKQWSHGDIISRNLRKRHKETPIAAVVAACDFLAPIRFLVLTAKELGIPSFYINHGFGNFASIPHAALKYAHPSVQAPITDFVFVDSDLSSDIAKSESGKKVDPKYYITGSPCADSGFVRSYTNTSVDMDVLKIAYCTGWLEATTPMAACLYEYAEYQVYSKCCQLVLDLQAEYHKVELSVKLHPTLLKLLETDISDFFIQRARELGVEVRLFEGDIHDLLSCSDLMVTAYCSSTNEEAFYYGVPSLTCLTPHIMEHIQEQKRSAITHLSKWGVQSFVSVEGSWKNNALSLLEKKKQGAFISLAAEKSKEIAAIRSNNGIKQIVRHISDIVDGDDIDSLIRKLKEAATSQNHSHKIVENKKLSILMVVHGFPPFSNGGTELYTYNISRELKKIGHHLTVLHPVENKQRAFCSFHKKEHHGLDVIEFNTYRTDKTPKLDFWSADYDQAFQNLLNENKFDIIHFQHLLGLSANWIKIAKLNNASTMLKLDDFWFFCIGIHLNNYKYEYCSGPDFDKKCGSCLIGKFIGSKHKDIKEKAAKYLTERRNYLIDIFKQVDVVHTPSYFSKDIHEKYGFRNDCFRVIPTGILPYERAKKKRHTDREKEMHIGFMGHIALRKGILDFIEAVTIYQNQSSMDNKTRRLFFHIWGKHYNDQLFNYIIQKINLIENLKYHGGFNPDDRKGIFSKIDMLVVPSSGENYPFIIREALFSSVPVISTKIAGVPEIIADHVNGFLYDQGDTAGLAGIFNLLAIDANVIKKLNPDPSNIRLIGDEALEIDHIYSELIMQNRR